MTSKIAVITGCSSGIGLALAVMMAKDTDKRYKVYATMRNLAKKGALETAADDTLDKTLFVRCLDVTKDDSVNTFFGDVLKEDGRVDILVNNAGIAMSAPLEALPIGKLRQLMETNYFGPLRTIQAVLQPMKKQRSGRIVNVSSLVGFQGFPYGEVYASSKFAVEGLSESLAPILRKFDISLSVIQFGPVDSAIGGNTADLMKGIDASSFDQYTTDLFKVTSDSFQKIIGGPMIQTTEEAAGVVFRILREEKPKLRYQSSKMVSEQAEAKFHDPSGEKSVQVAMNMLYGEDSA